MKLIFSKTNYNKILMIEPVLGPSPAPRQNQLVFASFVPTNESNTGFMFNLGPWRGSVCETDSERRRA